MMIKASSNSKVRNCGRRDTAKHEHDRISELPDAILVCIISSILTIDAVRTSILSKRWRNVWTSVPNIKIYDWPEYFKTKDCFTNFVDRVLLRSHDEVSCLRKLSLCCSTYYHVLSDIKRWISVVTKLNLEKLNLNLMFAGYHRLELPLSIFNCEKLVSLKLSMDVILNVPSSGCLPNLKKLDLLSVKGLEDDSVKNLIACCPVLEEFYIYGCNQDKTAKTLHVQSTSLKRLIIFSGGCYFNSSLVRIVIDAVNLEKLWLTVDATEQMDVSSLSSLVSVRLDVMSSSKLTTYGSRIVELLRKMSNIQYLCLSLENLEHERLNSLPNFKNLTHLEAGSYYCSCPILPCLLESSPNLISLVLWKAALIDEHAPYPQSLMPKTVMLLYLEKIELRGLHGCDDEMELAGCFLKNAPALKKMFVQFCRYLKPTQVSFLEGRVCELRKASTACEIEIMGRTQ